MLPAERSFSKCVTCMKLSGMKGEQFMEDLPQENVTPVDPPFTNMGVDFFGPFELKHGRATVKWYGVIFFRAVSTLTHALKPSGDFLQEQAQLRL